MRRGKLAILVVGMFAGAVLALPVNAGAVEWGEGTVGYGEEPCNVSFAYYGTAPGSVDIYELASTEFCDGPTLTSIGGGVFHATFAPSGAVSGTITYRADLLSGFIKCYYQGDVTGVGSWNGGGPVTAIVSGDFTRTGGSTNWCSSYLNGTTFDLEF